MGDLLTINQSVKRARSEGFQISDYMLRKWVAAGLIPTVSPGKKILIYYPNLLAYLKTGGHPETLVAAAPALRVVKG